MPSSGHRTLGMSFFQTQTRTECLKLTFTCMPRCSRLSITCRFPGDTGARGAPSTGVSSRTGALVSALDRWRLGRWRSFNPADVLPSCPAAVVGSTSVIPPLQSSLPWLLLWYLLALSSRSFDRWYLTHWRSFTALSVGGTSRTSAPSGAVDRADDIPALWQVIVGFSINIWTTLVSCVCARDHNGGHRVIHRLYIHL